jgi:hypothetical protein
MKKIGEMDLGSATNIFFAIEADPSQPMLELTHNHDRPESYDKGDGYAHVAFTFTLDGLEETGDTQGRGRQGNAGTQDPGCRRGRLQDRLHRGSRRLQDRARRAWHHEGGGEMYK